MIFTSILIGLALGYALQRGRFCLNTAFRDLLLMRDTTLLRAWALALLIQMIGVHALSELRLFQPDVPPFFWLANLVGGLTFGIGMVLAGGCASGTCYRVGEGMVGSLIALMGFGMMALATDIGALQPIQTLLRSSVLLVNEEPAKLTNLTSLNPWVLIVLIAIPLDIWLFRAKSSAFQPGWSWHTTGIVLGLLSLAAWLSSSAAGRAYGISINGPIRSLFEFVLTGKSDVLDWGSFLVLGLISGAFVSSWLYGEAKLRLPTARRTLQALGGGLLMGFGAQVAGGCTVGHGFTGLSLFALGSIVTTLSIALGTWTTSFFLFMDGGQFIRKWLTGKSIPQISVTNKG